MKKTPASNTSWEKVENWYDKIVGLEGHYYHQNVIIPGALKLLDLKEGSKLLDIGCGQGVLSRHIPDKMIDYVGIDFSPSLIKSARRASPIKKFQFHTADACKPLPIKDTDFTHAAIILALQNMEDPLCVIQNAAKHLKPGGKLLIALNHPCFRIPRQSSWQIDESKKMQYRRVDRYFTPMKIPLQAEPSKGAASVQTLSYHHPLSSYTAWLKEAGFKIILIEEWLSDKQSTGKAAKMENRARQEFPLFLAILATI